MLNFKFNDKEVQKGFRNKFKKETCYYTCPTVRSPTRRISCSNPMVFIDGDIPPTSCDDLSRTGQTIGEPKICVAETHDNSLFIIPLIELDSFRIGHFNDFWYLFKSLLK